MLHVLERGAELNKWRQRQQRGHMNVSIRAELEPPRRRRMAQHLCHERAEPCAHPRAATERLLRWGRGATLRPALLFRAAAGMFAVVRFLSSSGTSLTAAVGT